MTPAARIEGLGTTVFTEMSALAARTGAINLGQGFPDTDGPAEAVEAAVAALRAGENQYAPLPGVPARKPFCTNPTPSPAAPIACSPRACTGAT